jgi:hypothetical protein
MLYTINSSMEDPAPYTSLYSQVERYTSSEYTVVAS